MTGTQLDMLVFFSGFAVCAVIVYIIREVFSDGKD
jgi:hypothetical protein